MLNKQSIAAAVIDTIIGIALLVIGTCATQLGFLPVSVQFSLIGVGITYLVLHLIKVGTVIKTLHSKKIPKWRK